MCINFEIDLALQARQEFFSGHIVMTKHRHLREFEVAARYSRHRQPIKTIQDVYREHKYL